VPGLVSEVQSAKRSIALVTNDVIRMCSIVILFYFVNKCLLQILLKAQADGIIPLFCCCNIKDVLQWCILLRVIYSSLSGVFC
jgi:hypothetical protein